MKRLALTLVAGAFGSLMLLPVAHAGWSDWDMSNDANAIRQDNRISSMIGKNSVR